MKKFTLRALILTSSLVLAPITNSAITLNGVKFDQFTMSSTTNGDITVVTGNQPPAESSGVIPTPITPPVTTTLCGTLNSKLVSENLIWSSIPTKRTIKTGTLGTSSKFTTTNSTVYRGYFSAVPSTESSNLTRRLWFSECPGGVPITTYYLHVGNQKNGCDVSGNEIKLSWSQEDKPLYVTTCKLPRNKTLYLNHSQSAIGAGPGPTINSEFIRGASQGGTP